MAIDLPEIPKVPDLSGATIKALDGLGESASDDEIDDRVGDLLALSAEVRGFIHKAGTLPKVNYRCALFRSWLKNAGLVKNSGRGVWSLTVLGRSALIQYNEAELVKRVRQANYALRKGMSLCGLSRRTKSAPAITRPARRGDVCSADRSR